MNRVAVRIIGRDGGYLVVPRSDPQRWFAHFDDAWAWSVPYFAGRKPNAPVAQRQSRPES